MNYPIIRTAYGIAGSSEQRAARADRDTFLNWKPARGGQMAIAMVDALVQRKDPQGAFTGDVGARIAQNVRAMR